MIPGNANPLLLKTAAAAAAGDTGRSLRFNKDDQAYLERTPSSAGNRKTFTFSAWVKNDFKPSNNPRIFSAGTSSTNAFEITLLATAEGNELRVMSDQSGQGRHILWTTAAKFRDPSAWFHVCVAVDTTQGTTANRLKVYINGSQVTETNLNTYPGQNDTTEVNNTSKQYIGRTGVYTGYMNGLLTDVYLIDGLQLAATSFGSYDSNGVWQRGTYSGTFGTNGFHLLDFENESTIGDDSSGNSNDFTAYNLSDAAGAGNDVLFDFPQNGSATDSGAGGEVNGNYCTWNPLRSGATFSNGNLDVAVPAAHSPIVGTIGVSSGKWYAEFTATNVNSAAGAAVGVAEETISGGLLARSDTWTYYFNGQKYHDGASASYGSSWTTNDVLGVAVDMDNGKIWFSKNGTFQASGDPAAGTNAAYTNLSGKTIFWTVGDGDSSNSGTTFVANFGQRSWEYSAPSGFKAMNTASLPTPTVADGSDYMDIKLYTGNGGSQSITSLDFSPSFVWIKNRSSFTNQTHAWFDVIRGKQMLASSSTNSEANWHGSNSLPFRGYVDSFDSNGFSLVPNSASNKADYVNFNNTTYVAWCWNGASSTASNTDGSITSSVRANQTAGFSIVSYTGNGSSGTVGHGLSSEPHMIIAKDRDASTNWFVYFKDLGSNAVLLNSTAEAFSPAPAGINAASSSTFTLGGARGETNTNGNDYIAYCFAPVSGYQALGQFTGNADSGGDGPFVHTGFAVRWLMIKGYDASNDNWKVYDNARSPFNVADDWLAPNSGSAETTSNNNKVDFLSNGFKIRTTGGGDSNLSTKRYIYLAIAENPFQANGGLAR